MLTLFAGILARVRKAITKHFLKGDWGTSCRRDYPRHGWYLLGNYPEEGVVVSMDQDMTETRVESVHGWWKASSA